MSGHSKWSTIKHKKAAQDAKRGKLFTKLIKEVTVAARVGGGDIDANPRLRTAVANARGQSMPMDNIMRAIKKATGEGEGDNYEEIVYEGYGPHNVAIIVEAMTDNRNRTIASIRTLSTNRVAVWVPLTLCNTCLIDLDKLRLRKTRSAKMH